MGLASLLPRRRSAGERQGRLEREVGRLLTAQGLTLAVAESCTGGLLGGRVTAVSGSSIYFAGGVIAYSNEVKVRLLGVDRVVLAAHGAVSAPVARQMATGVRSRIGADLGVAITGVAGPGGGTAAKPVGLVFVALARNGGCVVRRFRFDGARATVRRAAGDAALEMIKSELLKRSR